MVCSDKRMGSKSPTADFESTATYRCRDSRALRWGIAWLDWPIEPVFFYIVALQLAFSSFVVKEAKRKHTNRQG
ncbi:hypothetical protein D3C87_1743910 [compost metagenome]